jgi:hypothetical protein
MERAMHFLAQTDIEFAQEKAELLKAEILRKRVRSRIFLTAEGTVASREHAAEVHPDVVAADDAYIASVKTFETLKAKRQKSELIIEVWRSLESSRRKAA